jgi:hypothetical protein
MDVPFDDPKVTALKPKERKTPGGNTLHVAHGHACRHTHVTVDPTLATLQCNDCKEKLDPIPYIVMLAHHEHRLWVRGAEMHAAAELAAQKTRTKCEHCGKMTRVNTRGMRHDLREAAAKSGREFMGEE